MAEIQILGRAGAVVETGERSWYAGPSSPVGRLLHCTVGPLRETAEVTVPCVSGPMPLYPRVDRDGLRRCASCCQAAKVRAGYGVPPVRKLGPVAEVLADDLSTFTVSWPLDAEDRKFTAGQLGVVTERHLEAEAEAAGFRLVGGPRWEFADDGTAHGALMATTDARRILVRGTDARGVA